MKTQLFYFAVQGLRNGAFVTLFAPFLTEADANKMADSLRDRNPACTYRVMMKLYREAGGF